MISTLTLALTLILAFAIMMYVLLDGFDLGIGILFPFLKNQEDKNILLNTIAPIWDGNETWLILGGTTLFAGFPRAYALILPALYLPLLFFLIGLILRGVAFEFSFKTQKNQWVWNWSFAGGSILATFMQGIVLGRFIEGFSVLTEHPLVLGRQVITPFSIMTGVALLFGYALLGSTWLIIKTEGKLQKWCYKQAAWLMWAMIFFIAVVSLWTPFTQAAIAERWFAWPNIVFLCPIPIHCGLLTVLFFWGLHKQHEYVPFFCSMGLFMLSALGLGVSLWPYIVPRVLTIWDAASPPESQIFILTGICLLVPLILAYTVHAYWVFKGKVDKNAGYYH